MILTNQVIFVISFINKILFVKSRITQNIIYARLDRFIII